MPSTAKVAKPKAPKFTFDARVKTGYFSSDYFNKTVRVVGRAKLKQEVTQQYFMRGQDIVVCGLEEVKQLLKFAVPPKDIKKLKVKAGQDGNFTNQTQAVLTITGPYPLYGHLENLIDGTLARASNIATNVRKCKQAAGKKRLIFMADRCDHWINQERDGYAARIGGADAVVTRAQGDLYGQPAMGTMPHALIQQFKGNLIHAMEAYAETYPAEKLTALVDYNNNAIVDAVLAVQRFGEKLESVRVDTSPNLLDKVFWREGFNKEENMGVSLNLVKLLRQALDLNGGTHVKIIVSSGFTPDRIADFEAHGAPVDAYGVGAYFVTAGVQVTADCVAIDGAEQAKAGRKILDASLLSNVAL